MIRFDVFGTFIGVEPRRGGWKPDCLGNEGRRRDADFIIPDELIEDELAHGLAVLLHRSATPERSEVRRLDRR